MDEKKLLHYNKDAWNSQVNDNNQWTLPVTSKEIDQARDGDFSIVLTPLKPVPKNWFPPLQDCDVLALASGGGQQGPILAATGANVTVFDYSPKQLQQDILVAQRDNLNIKTVEGDMADLSIFPDDSFDFIFHPCSNCFVPKIKPVWHEAFRVLRPGGVMMSGFTNPLLYIFDDPWEKKGTPEVHYSIPYSDIESLPKEKLQLLIDQNEPLVYSHTLDKQMGAQMRAGFHLIDMYEDGSPEVNVDPHFQAFIATLALKPK